MLNITGEMHHLLKVSSWHIRRYMASRHAHVNPVCRQFLPSCFGGFVVSPFLRSSVCISFRARCSSSVTFCRCSGFPAVRSPLKRLRHRIGQTPQDAGHNPHGVWKYAKGARIKTRNRRPSDQMICATFKHLKKILLCHFSPPAAVHAVLMISTLTGYEPESHECTNTHNHTKRHRNLSRLPGKCSKEAGGKETRETKK